MRVLCTALEGEAEVLVAGILAQALRAQPDLVLGLATGRTMSGVYRDLFRRHREEGLDFSRCQTFNLDEYLGISADHPASYHQYMREHLFRKVNLRESRAHLPDGMAPDLSQECQRYEDLIRGAGGIDIQLLGLGLTGHIGFNEPGSSPRSTTHLARLSKLTRQQNSGPFGGDPLAVPTRAITMGLGTILAAGRCVLLVTGAAKASILGRALEGPITARVPGSLLRLHPDCTVVVDRAAATELARNDSFPPGGYELDQP